MTGRKVVTEGISNSELAELLNDLADAYGVDPDDLDATITYEVSGNLEWSGSCDKDVAEVFDVVFTMPQLEVILTVVYLPSGR